jgi:hypothetical protein
LTGLRRSRLVRLAPKKATTAMPLPRTTRHRSATLEAKANGAAAIAEKNAIECPS